LAAKEFNATEISGLKAADMEKRRVSKGKRLIEVKDVQQIKGKAMLGELCVVVVVVVVVVG
jgi:hypothetical protein